MEEHPYSNVALKYAGNRLALVDDAGNDLTDRLVDPSSKRQPDFLIVGMEKCATTWLLFALLAHPDIFALPFEADYFNKQARTVAFDEYLKLFSPARSDQIRGEKTPSYAAIERYPGTLELIREKLPDVKLILCLRDPVERTISAWRYHDRDRKEHVTLANFAAQFVENGAVSPALIENYAMKESLYPPVIERLYGLFPPENILIHFVEDDIRNDTENCIAKTYEFVGADKNFLPPQYRGMRNVNMEMPFDLSDYAKSILYDYFWPSIQETFSLVGRTSTVWSERKASMTTARESHDKEARLKILGNSFTGPEAVQFVQHLLDTRQLQGAALGLEALHAAYPENVSFRQTLGQIRRELGHSD